MMSNYINALTARQCTHLKDPLLDCTRHTKLMDVDITFLPEAMGTIKCLVLFLG